MTCAQPHSPRTARIAEELLLLLLSDNGAAKPALDQARLRRLLSAAVLLDLAYACRIRPTMPGDGAGENRLIALVGLDVPDPALARAWTLLARRPRSAARAIAQLQSDIENDLHGQLERTGRIRQVPFNSSGFKRRKQHPVWLLTNRTRASQACRHSLGPDRRHPTGTGDRSRHLTAARGGWPRRAAVVRPAGLGGGQRPGR